MKKYWSLIVLVVIFLIVKILFDNGNSFSRKIKQQEFEGTIKGKFFNEDNKGAASIQLENLNSVYRISNGKAYDLITPGDYIIKKKNSMEYILIHDKDTLIFYQYYKDKPLK